MSYKKQELLKHLNSPGVLVVHCFEFTSTWIHLGLLLFIVLSFQAPEFTWVSCCSLFWVHKHLNSPGVLVVHCFEFSSTWIHLGFLLFIVLSSQAPEFTWGYCCSLFWAFCVVLLCVFMFWFSHKAMFGSTFRPVVCRRAHILLTLFVFVCI
jgi:ABC-type dipeptide/oligopeptide/nickel transport system permease subunit